MIAALLPIASTAESNAAAAAAPRPTATPTATPTAPGATSPGAAYGPPSEEERMESIVALANIAENPDIHDAAFSGKQGVQVLELFV